MELRLENLSKRYPNGVQALKDVSLAIGPGLFGLLGPNGAGKSTLMRILATLQEADTGTARLDGIDVLREKDAVRRLLGYLPQDFGLYPKVTAQELLEHLALLKGLGDRKKRREAVSALLQQVNLYSVRHKRLGGFSGGMKQRFGIAQALLGDPKLVIVDEPTAGLDPQERVRFQNLLSDIGQNVIVILSTHIVSDVSDLCGDMAILDAGEVRLKGDPLEVVRRLEGKVWRTVVPKEKVEELQAKHAVISTRLLAGRTVVHVFAGARPAPEFEAVEPDLEDAYFAVITQRWSPERAAA